MSYSVDRPVDCAIELSIPGAPPDTVANATQQLVTELNREIGPIASRISDKAQPGARGDVALLGQIALALISGGVTGQIARILVQYIKRNPRYVLIVGNTKITKDYASREDIEAINSLVLELNAHAGKRK